jgi:PAS domain S-box-containing protein
MSKSVPDVLHFNETYKQFLNAINDMVFVKGPGSKLIWANKKFSEFYGMSAEELRDIIDAPFNEPDYTLKYIRDDLKVFTTGQTLHIPEEPATRHDGKVFWFETVKSPIYDGAGEIVMIVAVSRDITEKRIQDQLLIEQQQKTLVDSAKMVILGEMAGNIAHEMNNPLTIIQMLMKNISRTGQEEVIDKDKLLKQVQRAEAAIARIQKIISSVKGFAYQGAGDTSVTSGKVSDIWQDAVSFCEFSLKSKDIRLIYGKVDNEAEVLGVQSEFSQVLINLINNAADAVEGLEDRWIRFSTEIINDMVEIRVTDSGGGIEQQLHENLFKVSFTTKPIGKGTGLGLIISKKIVEKHSGRISVDHVQDHTCFVIQLPLSKAERAPLKHAS